LEAEHLPVPEETYDVAFSPDGERVLFAVTEGLGHGSELWMMNRDGSSLTRLVSEQRHILALPRWSPDGKRWAYIRMPDSEVPFPVGELWVMDGKNARLLSDWADAGRGYGPVWSPDGQTVAFVARENVADRLADLLLSRLESNLYLADIATGRVQAVTRFENAWIEEPVWSPDGHQLIFLWYNWSQAGHLASAPGVQAIFSADP
jgi:Tol biopolymer transport system component